MTTRTLKENEMLLQIGTQALRGPKGEIISKAAVCVIVRKPEAGTLTTGEASVCDDIASVLAGKFRQYTDGIRRADAC